VADLSSAIASVADGYGKVRLLAWSQSMKLQRWLLHAIRKELLAKARLLEGLSATTHHGALDLLRQTAPNTSVESERRLVDNGRVITSAGVAAGIDMSLHVVARLLGQDVAEETAHYMEYPWPRE